MAGFNTHYTFYEPDHFMSRQNKGNVKEQRKRYYIKYKEKIAEKRKQYYIKNKEKIAEKSKQYRIDNKQVK